MSRSKKKSISIPRAIIEAITEQFRRGLFRYPSENALHVGLWRYQAMIGKPHPITEEIARMGQVDQDLIDDFLLELNMRGLSLGGSFLEHIVERAVQEGKTKDSKKVVKLQATTIKDLAQRWGRGDESVWDEISSNQEE